MRRWIPVGRYALIALAAWSAAACVRAVALWALAPPATDTATQTRPVVTNEVRTRRRVESGVILKRNLFGAEPVAVATAEAPALPAADIELRLRGTARGSDGGGYAIVENVETRQQDVFATGQQIFDGPELLEVHDASVVVLFKGQRRTIELWRGEDAPPAPSTARTRNAPANPGKFSDDGIRSVSEGSYLVDRREIDHTLENLNYVITQARAVPVLKDGQSVGFKFFNIRPDSLFERMGLIDGDIVQEVNGVPVRDATKAMGLLDEVQSRDEIKVSFLRKGKPLTYTYNIR